MKVNKQKMLKILLEKKINPKDVVAKIEQE